MNQGIDKAAGWYAADGSGLLARALMQAVPFVGGSMDTILSARGNILNKQRLEAWCAIVDSKLLTIEEGKITRAGLESDEFFDLVRESIYASSRTKSDKKRICLAQVIANKIISEQSWDDAREATLMTNELEEIDLLIIEILKDKKLDDGPFMGSAVFSLDGKVSLEEDGTLINNISSLLEEKPELQIRLSIQRLYRLGLIYDEGINRIGIKGGHVFAPSDLSIWLANWISDHTQQPAQ